MAKKRALRSSAEDGSKGSDKEDQIDEAAPAEAKAPDGDTTEATEQEDSCDAWLPSAEMGDGEVVKGWDCGCTSVTVIIHGDPGALQVTTGWAGDSRAVMCRGGVAYDLSEDHKPTDGVELRRIRAVGSTVTAEGRVDGNLNLSRALGDFAHKQKKLFPAKEQAITGFPDVRTVQLTPADEFILIACDGIWNSMESQEAIDYVRQRLTKRPKLSLVCEELLDACMETNPDREDHDGNGMDNETAVIVLLNDSGQSRPGKALKAAVPDTGASGN